MLENKPVEKVDIMSYAGKWYSLYSIPTFMDKHWVETTETYVIHPDGYYAVFTTYKLPAEEETKYVRSKLIVVRGTSNAQLKAQFVWPLKVDYWVIELAEDYSYVVVGHPKHKHLSIMSRKPVLPETLLEEILGRCEEKGYDISKLVSQEHKATVQKGEIHSS
ncbi:apolipoprotein D and lipocalin family protein [Pedobacter cryoconitis]|uniref:Apolipoprotein D and lipocalin family protein n=1 Tax=Pedobacter cryoconitis TaxID=188932 RepID=A0A7W9DZG3_9SPHI|nr:lipocalin family protein [Pedobacter cryoconitis]MBB5636219.1 apolipoprotein D and lipocalin family protein [Pedobacter cryoconitis]MBB6272863.1 apolipoprotein D and lipocalin family protein [Pedobacter cryoconitis]